MIRILFRYLCAKPKGEAEPAPLFVFTEGSMPAAPFPQLLVKPDTSGRRFVVLEVHWDKGRPDVYTAYVALLGDANPLQASLTLDDMLKAGWQLP